MIRAGLIGFGLAGRYFHTPLMRAVGIAIDAVVSQRSDAVHAVLPNARVVHTEAELLASDVDLIVIATPNHLHATQARAALIANKHVVVDKPLCATSMQANELIELARNQRRMLTVFHNRRWDSDFLTIEKLCRTQRLGRLNAFHARWDRYRPQVADRWRERDEYGGVLYDLGPHLIDQAVQLLGMPEWIFADVAAQRPGATACDLFEIVMGHGSARSTLGVSTLAANGGPRYRVHGEFGSFVKHGLDVQETQLRADMLTSDERFGVEPESQWGTLTVGTSDIEERVRAERGRWAEFYAQVRACIEHGAIAPVSASDGQRVLRIIEAAMESSRSGRRVQL